MEQMPNTNNRQEEPIKDDEAFLRDLHDTLSHAFKNSENTMDLYGSITNFALGLEEKYPDVRSRRLWHLLVMSTPPSEIDMNMEDYPGEDSIVRFIKGL